MARSALFVDRETDVGRGLPSRKEVDEERRGKREGKGKRAADEIVTMHKGVERTISMDASQVLWEKWEEQVKGLFPKLHAHQQKLLALIVAGMVVSGCAVLQRVAENMVYGKDSPENAPRL